MNAVSVIQPLYAVLTENISLYVILAYLRAIVCFLPSISVRSVVKKMKITSISVVTLYVRNATVLEIMLVLNKPESKLKRLEESI